MQRFIVLIILITLAIYQVWTTRSVSRPQSWILKADPEQNIYANPEPPFQFKEALVTKIADYKIKARVLSTERYWLGSMADIAPVDVALGWNEMSKTDVIEKLTISQADRFYFYTWKDKDLVDPVVAMRNSANMHLIPANKYIENRIKALRVGQVVSLLGQLANVQMPGSPMIKSSTTRDDSGPGACEVMWVTSIEIFD